MWIRTLVLTLLAGSPAALAADSALVYDIRSGDRIVGSRTVSVRVVPPDGDLIPETRLITSITKVDASVAGVPMQLHSRADARATDRKISFVASTVTNGDSVEIQARQGPDGGWMVTALTPGNIQEMTYRAVEVDLTSMDLLDPMRARLFTADLGTAELLLAETGTVVEGAVRDGGPVEMQVGAVTVPGRRVELSLPTGASAFVWSDQGLLLQQDLTVLGTRLTATLRALPAARTWGQVEVATEFTAPGTSIHEQEL
jgi:hypothetical protein